MNGGLRSQAVLLLLYYSQIRARLGTAAHFCEVVVLKLRTAPIAGSPAAESGQLKKGDVLAQVNGEDVYRKSVVIDSRHVLRGDLSIYLPTYLCMYLYLYLYLSYLCMYLSLGIV